jgi:uncharacterized protein YcbX
VVNPFLARITIYPIKSLDGVAIEDGEILANGALAGDRRFALLDDGGRFINGKRTAMVHSVRADFDLIAMRVRLMSNLTNADEQFSLSDAAGMGRWFSDALGMACTVAENIDSGFPDDTQAPGPTVVSTATLREVSGWFPTLSIDEVRRRFRANLEIDGVDPFWEDHLVGAGRTEVPFMIGGLRWLGVNACQRCVVPTRASDTGEEMPQFQKTFAKRREQRIPSWAASDRFDHFYRLAVNTRLAAGQQGGTIRVGDTVRLG